MTNIQRARDVLAKWREEADASEAQTDTDGELSLVDGTAGNPDLLDAIDAMLAGEATTTDPDVYVVDLAAAILTANERMSA